MPEVIKKRFLVLVLAKLINHNVRRQLGEMINTRTVQSTFNQTNVTLYLLRNSQNLIFKSVIDFTYLLLRFYVV